MGSPKEAGGFQKVNGYRSAREAMQAIKGNVCPVCGEMASCLCGRCGLHCPSPQEHAMALRREGPVEIKQPPQRTHAPLPKDCVKAWARAVMGRHLD